MSFLISAFLVLSVWRVFVSHVHHVLLLSNLSHFSSLFNTVTLGSLPVGCCSVCCLHLNHQKRGILVAFLNRSCLGCRLVCMQKFIATVTQTFLYCCLSRKQKYLHLTSNNSWRLLIMASRKPFLLAFSITKSPEVLDRLNVRLLVFFVGFFFPLKIFFN